MIKRALSIALWAGILLFGITTAFAAISNGDMPSSVLDLSRWANHAVKLKLSDSHRLKSIAPTLLLSAGAQEQDGIFVTQDYLLENISEPNSEILEHNLFGVERFLEKQNTATAFMLIPTACAIKQQELPASAKIFNQKALISQCYDRLSGQTRTIDAYSKLFAAKEQYTYCRTESNLTGLGGYYVYTAIASRLGITPRALDQFEVENLAEDYYGELYQRSSFKSISPDLITLYRFSRFSRQYQLSITENGESKNYYSLFPTHLASLGKAKSVILGGFGEQMDISVVSPYEESLLILGDETVLSYLPFLVVHYGNITVLDVSHCSAEALEAISVDYYDQVLFAYSVDNFIHKDVCSQAERIDL